MKIFYSIVLFLAVIIIITLGLKRSNAFFRDTRNLGELNYLTPAAKTEPADTTAKKAEPAMESEKAAEKKEGEEAKKE